jgi:large subunit ribosomal protein L35
MPKMKSKSSAKKRFSMTATGKVRATQAHKRHNLSKLSKRSMRNNRGTTILKDCDAPKIIKFYLPYGR